MFAGGKVNTWAHFRAPTAIDEQAVIRMNRDTLYSAILVDISKGDTSADRIFRQRVQRSSWS